MSKASNYLIAIDDGHGMKTAGKRTPTVNGVYMPENDFNRDVVKYLDVHLKRQGFKTLLVAPTDDDTPLEVRTKLANDKKASIYLSIHANANTGKFGSWGGIETFSMHWGEGYKIATACHLEVMKGTKLTNRGLKDGSHLWVIRKTNMPAVLFELGFMDSHKDYQYLLTDAYRKECAMEIAMGICRYYGVTYKPESKPVVKTVAKPIIKTVSKAIIKTCDCDCDCDCKPVVKPVVKKAAKAKVNPITPLKGTVKVIVKDLSYYDAPKWEAKAGKTKLNDVYTVVGFMMVDGYKMYVLKSGTYLTASTKYVKFSK